METVPGLNVRNTWNVNKSKRLIKFYGDADQSDTEEDETKDLDKARALRLKVANAVGVSKAQLTL